MSCLLKVNRWQKSGYDSEEEEAIFGVWESDDWFWVEVFGISSLIFGSLGEPDSLGRPSKTLAKLEAFNDVGGSRVAF